MNAALRELSDQIDQATQRLLDTARIITEPDLRAPSQLPGWTRAHVLAHVARNADAMRNVLVGVRTGQDRPGYASAEAREAGIEQDAGRPGRELTADLADSAMALRTMARRLPGDGWQVLVRMLDPGARFPAAQLLTRRLVEVELHHSDLGAGYGPADWPAAFRVAAFLAFAGAFFPPVAFFAAADFTDLAALPALPLAPRGLSALPFSASSVTASGSVIASIAMSRGRFATVLPCCT